MRLPITNSTDEAILPTNNLEQIETNKGVTEDQNIEQLEVHETSHIKSSNKIASATNTTSEIVQNPSTEADYDYMWKFITWKYDILDSKMPLCKKLETENLQNAEKKKEELKIVPKCLLHLAKKLCNLDPYYVDFFSDNLNFYKDCSIFDMQNIRTDDKYIEGCDKYDYRPINGEMVKYDVGKYVDEAKDIFFKKLDELCDDTNKIYEMKHSAYELRDECFNKETCLFDAVNRNLKLYCLNEDFDEQIKEISKVLNVELKQGYNMNLIVNRIIPSSRNLRSIEEISTFDTVSTFEDSNNLQLSNSTEVKDFNINTVAPVSVAGVVLISLLGLYSVKNKKNKMKFGCGLTGASMVAISLIIYLISSGIFN